MLLTRNSAANLIYLFLIDKLLSLFDAKLSCRVLSRIFFRIPKQNGKQGKKPQNERVV